MTLARMLALSSPSDPKWISGCAMSWLVCHWAQGRGGDGRETVSGQERKDRYWNYDS